MYAHKKAPPGAGQEGQGQKGTDNKSDQIIDLPTSSVKPDLTSSEVAQSIVRSLSILHSPGDTRELALADPQVKKHRLWGGVYAGGKAPMVCGWYRDLQKLARDATEADAQARPISIYVTLNPVSDALLGRANERLKASADRTQDVDIARRDWFYIDLDPNRPKGISSTDAEKQAAWDLACAAKDYFIEHGWPESVIADSGNGYHLVFRIDLPNDEASRAIIQACLQAAAYLFSTDLVSVDTAVFNAARLIKLWGTMARKGDDTTDRPHRRSGLLHVPDKIETVTVEQLQWLAAQAPDTTPQRKEAQQPNQRQNDNSGQLDVQAYLAHYGVQVVGTRRNGNSTLYLLECCLFDQTHTAKESAVGQGDDGALFYWCFHNSCQGRTWHDARRVISGNDSLAPFMPGMDRRAPPKGEQPAPQPEQAQQPAKRPGFGLIRVCDLECKPPEWLVRDHLEADTLAVAFGDPASGKSFFGIGIGCSIATGADFYGLPTKQGPVIYIAGEGRNGIARRLKAWEIRNGLDLSTAPFFISTGPAALCDPGSTAQVLAAVDQVGKDTPLKLVVIDTLARNFGPGDENSAKDMSTAIQAMDAIRLKYGCTVLIIHHTGHGDKTRERGSIALRGGLDASYRLDKDENGVVRLTSLKMKESELPEPMAFKIRSVELGFQDEDGREVTSAVLDPVDYEPPPKPTKAGRGKWQQVALEQLKRLEQEHRDRLERGGFDPDQARVTLESWRDACLKEGMSRQSWNNARHSLSGQKLIFLEDQHVKSQ